MPTNQHSINLASDILIVDDDAVVSERLRGLLERRRFAVETLDDAQAAIELVRSEVACEQEPNSLIQFVLQQTSVGRQIAH